MMTDKRLAWFAGLIAAVVCWRFGFEIEAGGKTSALIKIKQTFIRKRACKNGLIETKHLIFRWGL